MVRKERLELSRRKTLEPKSSASTNFATSAQNPGKAIRRAQTRRGMVSQNVSRFNDSSLKRGMPKGGGTSRGGASYCWRNRRICLSYA